MKKLLKILGFMGSLAVGIATVNYLIKSSKISDSVVSGASVIDTSASAVYSPNKSVKISRLEKIQENYQPKAFEEIPVEFVQIANSDIDQGKKSSQLESDNAAKQSTTPADKMVKVEQGSMYPFSSSKSDQQQSMPTQSDINPFEGNNYYPADYNMGYKPKNNTVSGHDMNHSPAQSQNVYPAYQDQQPDKRKRHVQRLNDDIDYSNTREYNPTMIPSSENIEQQAPQEKNMQGSNKNSSSWKDYVAKDLLGAGLAGIGSYAGKKLYDWFNKPTETTTKETEQQEPVKTEEQVSDVSSSNINQDLAMAVGSGAAVAAGGLAYNQYQKSSQSASKPVETKLNEATHKVQSKAGITDMNQTPTELSTLDTMIEVDQAVASGKNIESQKCNSRPGIAQGSEPLQLSEIVNPIASHVQAENTGSLMVRSDVMQAQILNGEITASSCFKQLEQKRTEALSVLGVDANATSRQIKLAFNDAVLKLHPDKVTSVDTARFIQVTDAYKFLTQDYPQGIQAVQHALELKSQEAVLLPTNELVEQVTTGSSNVEMIKSDVALSEQAQKLLVQTNSLPEVKNSPIASVDQLSNSYWDSAWSLLTSKPVLYSFAAAAAVASAPLVLPTAAVATPLIATPAAMTAPIAATAIAPVATSVIGSMTPSALAAFGLKALFVAKTAAKFLPGPTGIVARLIP